MKNSITAAFIGNPNCGKTTLFNLYTGAKLKSANWPGVTVERKEGVMEFDGKIIELVDLPGVYSLDAYTTEEKISRDYIKGDNADVIIDIVDASSLERNLYLAMQLCELGKPVVIALNMMDIIQKRGVEIDTKAMSEMLGGVPVVEVSARKRTGMNLLMKTVLECADKSTEKLCFKKADDINGRYEYIGEILNKSVRYSSKRDGMHDMTDKADRILTHHIWGMPIFLFIIAMVFVLTFVFGDMLKVLFENWMNSFSDAVGAGLAGLKVNEAVISLVTDGIISGVGGIISFIPNIAVLFFLLALLEDSGYMSRVAYIADGIMSRLGLSGRAVIPLLLGLGCSVPAIMSARILKDERDRLKIIMITPFISCSARLPIYIFLSDMFFRKYAALAACSMYIIGIIVAIIAAFVISKYDKSGEEGGLLIELPEYKMPSIRSVGVYVWEKVKDYLERAGTVIFLASVVMWFLMNYGMAGRTEDVSQSFGAMIGNCLSPFMMPAGLGDWRIVLSLISGVAAKEVVVSSMNVLYGAGSSAHLYTMLSSSGFTAINAYAMMLFCLLYVPCIATIATIRRESGSVKYTIFTICMQLAVAWTAAVVFYRVAEFIIKLI